jgi:Resolvase, N terminal domain
MPDHLTGHIVPPRGATAFALEVFEEDGTPEPARAALGAKECACTGRKGERLQEFLRRAMVRHGDLIEEKGAATNEGLRHLRQRGGERSAHRGPTCATRRATIKVPVTAARAGFWPKEDGAMQVGYARVSTSDQSLAVQLDALQHQGCTKIVQEVASGA